jgi:peptidoglycan/LPS O-acetylase OafA/YrhL
LGITLFAVFGLADVTRYEPLYCVFFLRNIFPTHDLAQIVSRPPNWGTPMALPAAPFGGVHLGHFWSLAIEEQFYLLWPLLFVVLRNNRRRLAVAIGLIAAEPFWVHLVGKLSGGMANVNVGRFDLDYDALMIGCALAIARTDPQTRRFLSRRIFTSTPSALVAVAVVIAGNRNLPIPAFAPLFAHLGVAAFINFAVERSDGAIGWFLNTKPMVWIGQLSYGLYLWQQLFCFRSELGWFGSFPQNVLATVLVSALSFYLLETPLAKVRQRLSEKRHVPRTADPFPQKATVAAAGQA